MSAKLFVVGHKPVDYGFPENELYQPIQVGSQPKFLSMTDHDQEPNWAAWNPIMAENTANLYIAKYEAQKYDYVGTFQYRRHLGFRPENEEEVEEMFKKYDIVASYPLRMTNSVEEQYKRCHSRIDLDIIGDILPTEQKDMWERTRKGNILFYSNGFLMRSEDYVEYYKWLEAVFTAYLRERGINTPEEALKVFGSDIKRHDRKNTRGFRYQSQVLGFISERLYTMWVMNKYETDRVAIFPYKKMEDIPI